MVDALLDALDRVSVWVDELERQPIAGDAEGASVELSKRLRATVLPLPTNEICRDRCHGGARRRWVNSRRKTGTGIHRNHRRRSAALRRFHHRRWLLLSWRRPVQPVSAAYRAQGIAGVRPRTAVRGRDRSVPQRPGVPRPGGPATRRGGALVPLCHQRVTIVAIPPGADTAGRLLRRRTGRSGFRQECQRRLAARNFVGHAPLRDATRAEQRALWVASALRWLDAVLAAPLPPVAWASAVVAASPTARPPCGGTGPSEASRRQPRCIDCTLGQADGGAFWPNSCGSSRCRAAPRCCSVA